MTEISFSGELSKVDKKDKKSVERWKESKTVAKCYRATAARGWHATSEAHHTHTHTHTL